MRRFQILLFKDFTFFEDERKVPEDQMKYTIVHISHSNESITLIIGTNIRQHKELLMIKIKVTLKDAEGFQVKGKGHKK